MRGERMGTIEQPLNDSKGCGGVMRVAPIGLVADDEQAAFRLACEAAAITHGHPSGYYSAGCFAAIVSFLREGQSLPDAIERALEILVTAENKGDEECAEAIRRAVALWRDSALGPVRPGDDRKTGWRLGR